MPTHHGKLGPRAVGAPDTHAHRRLADAKQRKPVSELSHGRFRLCDILAKMEENVARVGRWVPGAAAGPDSDTQGRELFQGRELHSVTCFPGRLRDSTTHGTEHRRKRRRCRRHLKNEKRNKSHGQKVSPEHRDSTESEQW